MTPSIYRVVALFRVELNIVMARWEFWGFFLAYWAILFTYLYPLLSGRLPDEMREWEAIWTATLPRAGFVGLLISSALVAVITGSEFTWRTARQSVVHGMSRIGLLLTKIQQGLIITWCFWIGTLTTVTVIGAISHATGPLLSRTVVLMLGSFLLALFGYGVLAFSITFLLRKTAAAMGLWLLYALAIEPQIAGAMEAREALQLISQALPAGLYRSLLNPVPTDASLNTGNTLPFEVVLLLGIVYVVFLIVSSWFVLVKRDL